MLWKHRVKYYKACVNTTVEAVVSLPNFPAFVDVRQM